MTIPTCPPTWTGYKVKTGPVNLPVTLATMKETLRLETDEDDQDTLLTNAIKAARGLVEQNGCVLITTVFQAFYETFPDVLLLPIAYPMQSVDSIKYLDVDGVEQTLDSSKYRVDVDHVPCRIEPAYEESWPDIRSVSKTITVEYTAGFGDDTTDVDETYAAAVQSIVVDIYEHPELQVVGTITGFSKTSQMLLDLTKVPKSW